MQGLSFDGWLQVARYFTVTDLCRCTAVSHEWFYVWISDRMWMHQRARVCAAYPELTSVFDSYPGKEEPGARIATGSIKSNSNKKRKTAWIMPRRGGIWYVFAKILSKGFYMHEIKSKLICNTDRYPVVVAIVKSCTERPRCFTRRTSYARGGSDRKGVLFFVTLETPKYRVVAIVSWGESMFVWEIYRMDNGSSTRLFFGGGNPMLHNRGLQISPWMRFLLEREKVEYGYELHPSPEFLELLDEK